VWLVTLKEHDSVSAGELQPTHETGGVTSGTEAAQNVTCIHIMCVHVCVTC
jgi:hypothetical protein